MRNLLIPLVLFLLTACDNKTATPPEFGVSLESCILTAQPDNAALYNFQAVLRINEGAGHSGVVSEIHRNGVLVAVEYFDMAAFDWHRDIHGDFIGNNRTVTIYPADVEGAHLLNGYAMIEGTPFPLQINQLQMPSGYVPTGRVVRADKSKAVVVTIAAASDGVTIGLNGKTHVFPHG